MVQTTTTTNSNPEAADHTWISNLRGISIIMIIISHVYGSWLIKIDTLHPIEWWFVNLSCSLTRFCVPIFLMVSGALLLSKTNEAIPFYKKRFTKVFIPFFLWSTVYTLLFLTYELYKGNLHSMGEFFEYIFNSYIFGAAYHLWYFYLLFSLYLILPFVGTWVKKFPSFKYAYVITWVIVICVAQFSNNHLFYAMRWAIGYFGYMVLGYFLFNIHIRKELAQKLGIIMFIVGLLITMFAGYYALINHDLDYYSWYYRVNINVALMAAGLFLFFKNIRFESGFLNVLAKNGLGIYLIHLIIIMGMNKIWPTGLNLPALVYLISFSSICLFISLYSIQQLRKLPYVGKYIM